MRQLVMFSAFLLSALVVEVPSTAQSATKLPRKVTGVAKAECAQGAICFSGEARAGHEFRRRLNERLEFAVRLPGGIDIVTDSALAGCHPQVWVANPPFRAHPAMEIDAGYDWTAEQEVETSPREFRFFTDCEDYQALYALSQTDAGQYFATLASLAKGHGRLWITGSKLSHDHDSAVVGNGAIEWIKFSVEITLASPK